MSIKLQTHTCSIFPLTSRNKKIKPEFLKKRFDSLVLFLHDYCWISSAAADNTEKQNNALIKNAGFFTEARKFSIIDNRVDKFCARIIDSYF